MYTVYNLAEHIKALSARSLVSIAASIRRYVSNDVDRTWASYKDEATTSGNLKWDDYREMVYGPRKSPYSP